ncbi:MAG TPA: DUF4956 domain-containing protein [Bacteroidales bacterium]|nr:DUF4956 domain-containing protein [Bacteroidales bacterium]
MLNLLAPFFSPDQTLGFIQAAADQGVEAIRILGVKLINPGDFFELLLRFLFNLIVTVVIIRFLYYPHSRRKDYFFIYMIFSVVVFLVCYSLASVSLQLGFALGLFAIFGILRYRTDTIPIKEMTYLFLMVGISVINSLTDKSVSYAELLFTNLVIIAVTWYLEKIWMQKKEDFMDIRYEKIELILPERRADLIQDIKKRTGLNVYRVSIDRINFMRDTAKIRIFYRQDSNVGPISKEAPKQTPPVDS